MALRVSGLSGLHDAMGGTIALWDSAELLLHLDEVNEATGPVCENYFSLFLRPSK